MSDRTSRSGRQWPVHGTPQRPSIRFPRMGSSVPTIRFRVVYGKQLKQPTICRRQKTLDQRSRLRREQP
jgi:hypothetical protein